MSQKPMWRVSTVLMCCLQPLGVHMFLESADKGLTPHLCRGVGWEPEISAVFTR